MAENGNKGTGRVLRHKIVNLMYLIFIVLAFLYIPSNFTDVFRNLNSSLEDATAEFSYDLSHKGINNIFSFNTLVFSYLLQSEGAEGERVKTNYIKIETASGQVLDALDELKLKLVEVSGGYNEYGFIKNSRNYKASEELMLENGQADSLLVLLTAFKNEVVPRVSEECRNKIDETLHVKPVVESSQGELKPWSSYYFSKMPVSGAITVLSKIQNEIRQTVNLVLEDYIFQLQGHTDSVIIGIYEKDFSELTAIVSKNGLADSLSLDSLGRIRFFPHEEGEYLFSIFNEAQKLEKTFIVKDLGPVVKQKTEQELFAGIDNPLHINHPDYPLDRIDVTATVGKVIRTNGRLYYRTGKPGVVTLKVFGIKDGKRFHLTSRKYRVKTLSDLTASIEGVNDDKLIAESLVSGKGLLLNSRLDQNKDFTVVNYHVKKIHKDNFKNQIVTKVNNGAAFSEEVKLMLRETVAGDMLIIDDIIAKGLEGVVVEVPPVIVKVI